MSNEKVLGAFFAVTLVAAAGTAWAASTPAHSASDGANASTAQRAAAKAFGKLSADGSRAFQDLTMTRLAIYDGKIDQAKTLVGNASAAFSKAQSDDSVFMKDEHQLKTVAQMGSKAQKPTTGQDLQAAQDLQAVQDPKAAPDHLDAATAPVAWLPVDGAISLDENYSLSPAKKQAVAEANQSLAKGDRAGAMDKLKLADVDMTVALEVVPIKQTISDMQQATQLIDAGKYYEGSQMLRKIQMAARYDVTDVIGTPKSAAP